MSETQPEQNTWLNSSIVATANVHDLHLDYQK